MRISLLIMAMIVCCLLGSCFSDEELPEVTEYVKVGDRVPQMALVLDDGTEIDSRSLLGKTSVLVFFSTKCKDCQQVLPVVQAFYDRVAQDPDLRVIAISRGEDNSVVAPYWQAHDLTLPYSAQADDHLFRLFASQGVPRIYVVDPDGFVTHIFTDANLPTLQTLIQISTH